MQTTAPFSVQMPEPPAEGVEGAEDAAGEPVPRGTVAEGAPDVPVTVTSVVEVDATGAAEGVTAALEVTAGALEAPGAKTPPPLEGRADAIGAADV